MTQHKQPDLGPLFAPRPVKRAPRPVTKLKAAIVQAATRTIAERFAEWLELNPTIYAEVVRYARAAQGAGEARYGMKAIFELIRYDHRIRARSRDFKLNNDFTAPMARRVMEREPDLAEFFETRERSNDA